MSLESGTIFGNPTFVTPSPKIDFKAQRVFATRNAMPWPAGARRRASVNSFGYGGSNVHVVLESAQQYLEDKHTVNYVSSYSAQETDLIEGDDEISSVSDVVKKPQLLVFSANDEPSLRAYVKRLRKHLINPRVRANLSDLAFTLSEKRSMHFNQAFLVANQTTLDEGALFVGKKALTAPKVAFVFTGQGAQWPQMGKALVDAFPMVKDLLKHLDTVLRAAVLAPAWSLLGTRPSNT